MSTYLRCLLDKILQRQFDRRFHRLGGEDVLTGCCPHRWYFEHLLTNGAVEIIFHAGWGHQELLCEEELDKVMSEVVEVVALSLTP